MGVIHGSKNGLYVRVIIGYTWKQEWAIHGSRIWEPYMEARMGYTRELYTGAIHGSKNGLYVRAIMGYIWKPYIGAIYGSKNGLYTL